MAKTMRALILKTHGDLGNLELVRDHPVPLVVAGHVVIRVRASSFNYHDLFTVKGMPGIRVPLPVIIGLDMAGEITKLGDGVANWKVGDRVLVNPVNKKKGLMGEMLDGGMAEYCLVSADQLVRIPDRVSFAEAASLPVAYGTAHRMLITHNTVKRSDKVLILGASGGVGTACVILAKLLGADVIACASGEEKLLRLKKLGADEEWSTTPKSIGRSGQSRSMASHNAVPMTAASTLSSISPVGIPGSPLCVASSAAASC